MINEKIIQILTTLGVVDKLLYSTETKTELLDIEKKNRSTLDTNIMQFSEEMQRSKKQNRKLVVRSE